MGEDDERVERTEIVHAINKANDETIQEMSRQEAISIAALVGASIAGEYYTEQALEDAAKAMRRQLRAGKLVLVREGDAERVVGPVKDVEYRDTRVVITWDLEESITLAPKVLEPYLKKPEPVKEG